MLMKLTLLSRGNVIDFGDDARPVVSGGLNSNEVRRIFFLHHNCDVAEVSGYNLLAPVSQAAVRVSGIIDNVGLQQ